MDFEDVTSRDESAIALNSNVMGLRIRLVQEIGILGIF